MKKKAMTVFLALILCFGLTAPVFASSRNERDRNYFLSYEMGEKTFEQIKGGEFYNKDEYIAVERDLKLSYWDGESVTAGEYNAVASGTTFTAKHAGATGNDNSYMIIAVTAFVNNGDGVYEQDWATDQILTEDGNFMDRNVVAALGNAIALHAGQSARFKLPAVYNSHMEPENDVIYGIVMYIDYPTLGMISNSNMYLYKVDDAAVNSYLEGQKSTPSFTDVPAGEYYAEPIAWAVENEITNGTSLTTFSPSQNCTHAQILTFLWRAADKPASSTKAPVAVADAYAGAVNWAYEKGMISNSFNPNANCTRLDAVSYIWQAFDKPAAVDCNFTDVSLTAPGGAAVKWAVFKGVTNGTSATTFSPNKVCSRGEIVTFLYRAYH